MDITTTCKAVAVAALAATAAAPAAAHATSPPRLQHEADRLLRYGTPGVLAGLRTDDGVLKVRAGYGDKTARTPVPWNARFRIGSMTKPFVATTLLQLEAEGKLSLDDSVDRWLPGVVRGTGIDGRRITVRQLLQHTSGLPDYVAAIPWILSRKGFERHRFDTITPQRAIALSMRQKPQFAPGTSWSYSNTNYVLAGQVIEAVTHRRWQDEVRDRIVVPLKLTGTTFPDTDPSMPQPHARGYERFPGKGFTAEDPRYGKAIDATRLNPSFGGAAGEAISTIDDTTTFLRALVQGRLLPPAQLAEMQHTVATSKAERGNWPGVRYGLGIMRIPTSCGVSWSHGGDIMGYMTRNAVSADGRRSVVVSYNTDAPKRRKGVPAPKHEMTLPLIDEALCG